MDSMRVVAPDALGSATDRERLTTQAGWLSILSSDGVLRVNKYARPIFEVTCHSLKMRRNASTDSEYVRQLSQGTRLHITELKRVDGAVRAHVVVLGLPKPLVEAPLGWITVIATMMQQDSNLTVIDNLVRHFDVNRDGRTSKMEFRASVRKLLPNAQIPDIDALFKTLDRDLSGFLDVAEIKAMLKELSAVVKGAQKEAKQGDQVFVAMSAKIDRLQRVIDATAAYESAIVAKAELEKTSVGARLGTLLKADNLMGLHGHTLVESWGERSGLISKPEFTKEALEILKKDVVADDPEDLAALFDLLDSNHNGSLDAAEVKLGLTNLMQMRGDLYEEMKRRTAEVQSKKTTALRYQREWAEEKVADEQAAQVRRTRAALDAEAEREAAARAMAAKVKKEAQKNEIEEMSRQEFEARVEDKRKKHQAEAAKLYALQHQPRVRPPSPVPRNRA
eukprot:jgi/Chrpa1/16720/Chrysochromulina_OHIO_Genome00009174-RA